MTDNVYKLKDGWLLCKPISSFLFLLALSSCQTLSSYTQFEQQNQKMMMLSKNQNLTNRVFKIYWNYFSPTGEKIQSFTSYVFVKDKNILRLDVLTPVLGSVAASFVLNHNQLLAWMPLTKQYYKGEFKSEVLFSGFDSFSSKIFFAILRAQTKDPVFFDWKCLSSLPNKSQCHKGDLTVKWEFKKFQLKKFWLVSKQAGHIEAQVLKTWVETEPLSANKFSPSLKDYKKQKVLSI